MENFQINYVKDADIFIHKSIIALAALLIFVLFTMVGFPAIWLAASGNETWSAGLGSWLLSTPAGLLLAFFFALCGGIALWLIQTKKDAARLKTLLEKAEIKIDKAKNKVKILFPERVHVEVGSIYISENGTATFEKMQKIHSYEVEMPVHIDIVSHGPNVDELFRAAKLPAIKIGSGIAAIVPKVSSKFVTDVPEICITKDDSYVVVKVLEKDIEVAPYLKDTHTVRIKLRTPTNKIIIGEFSGHGQLSIQSDEIRENMVLVCPQVHCAPLHSIYDILVSKKNSGYVAANINAKIIVEIVISSWQKVKGAINGKFIADG
jgi:hypothetical protein